MRRRVGTKWGLCRNPIDLMAQTVGGKKVSSTSSFQIMLNWLKMHLDRTSSSMMSLTSNGSTYIDNVICTVALSFNSRYNIYMLEENPKIELLEVLRLYRTAKSTFRSSSSMDIAV